MISNKTTAILFLITLNMQLAASTSKGTKRSRSPGKSVHAKKQKCPSGVGGVVPVLRDTSNNVDPVEVHGGSTEVMSTSQELSVPHVNNQLKTLIEEGEYGKIFEIGKEMNDEEFLEQICPVIETLGQYNGIVDYLKGRNLVASLYVYGNIDVVKGAIIAGSKVYEDRHHYVKDGDLEKALPLALENDKHDRVIKLLDVRKGITAENDEQLKRRREPTSFERFVNSFLVDLSLYGENGMTLRRFLIFHGDELRNKYPDILDTLCVMLLGSLRVVLSFPSAESLLIDLIGQPSLLTSVVFVREFLIPGKGLYLSDFIKYGWREAIQEGLKSDYPNGGEWLWRVMQRGQPAQFPGQFPGTEEARVAACMHIPTKREKEGEWIKNNEERIKKNALILYDKLKSHDSIFILLPDVIWTIISEYALYIS